jgi:hypothetical protein
LVGVVTRRAFGPATEARRNVEVAKQRIGPSRRFQAVVPSGDGWNIALKTDHLELTLKPKERFLGIGEHETEQQCSDGVGPDSI